MGIMSNAKKDSRAKRFSEVLLLIQEKRKERLTCLIIRKRVYK